MSKKRSKNVLNYDLYCKHRKYQSVFKNFSVKIMTTVPIPTEDMFYAAAITLSGWRSTKYSKHAIFMIVKGLET